MKETLAITNCKGIADAAIEIGRARQRILEHMRSAFERGDNAEALKFGKELCGLKTEKTGA
jgi:hypothetical protein